MMEKLRAKLKNQGGFTLIEMLIVVAIIAILIAVSIPLVNGALEKARDATDQANERAAKAEITMVYMGIAECPGAETTYVSGTAINDLFYNATTGKLVESYNDALTNSKGYGQCTGAGVGTGDCYTPYGQTDASTGHAGYVIKISAAADGAVTITWVNSGT